jgi:hypothetical protein
VRKLAVGHQHEVAAKRLEDPAEGVITAVAGRLNQAVNRSARVVPRSVRLVWLGHDPVFRSRGEPEVGETRAE